MRILIAMNTKSFAALAFLVGAVGITLEIMQIVFYDTHLSMEWSYPSTKWNYLAFFTVITNLAVDVWLLLVALSVLFKCKKFFQFLTRPQIQGALVLYITTVGIIYCTLLFWFIGPYSRTLWWANLIDMWNPLILPLAMIVLWLFAMRISMHGPAHSPITKRTLAYWMIYPLAYFAISVARGLVGDWYPYPFLRPSLILFPVGVAITTTCFLLVGSLIIWLYNRVVYIRVR